MLRALLLLLLPVVLWSQSTPWAPANPTKQSYSRDLAAAVAQVGTAGVIAPPPGTIAVSADITIPAGVKFAPATGAVLTIATGKTLTINGPFEAHAVQVFNCVGTGKVVFGSTSPVREVYPQWWGAKGDSSAGNSYVGTNCTAAFQAAIDTLRPVRLMDGGYYINATLTIPDQTSHPYQSFSLAGTNSNLNSSLARGNCFIEFDSTALFATKTAFVTTATSVRMEVRNICFFNHNGAATPTLFANVNVSTSTFRDNLVCRFGTCFNMWSGVNNIEGNHFIGMKDSTFNQLNSNYPADTWIRHNYISGDNTLGTVAHLKLYSSASIHVIDNYLDYAKIGVWFYYSGGATAGKAEVRGNTLDILYRGILIQQSSEVSIGLNVFRRCNLASRAGLMPNNPNAAWACIEVTTNSYNVTVVGNNYSDSDAFILLTGSGIWNLTECANVGNIASWPMIDWTAKTYDTVTYPMDGQKIQSLSRGLVRLAKSGTYTILPSDNYIVYTGTGSTLTLPAAYLGLNIRIKHAGSGTLTISRAGTDTIDAGTTKAMTAGQSFEFVGSGTNWDSN